MGKGPHIVEGGGLYRVGGSPVRGDNGAVVEHGIGCHEGTKFIGAACRIPDTASIVDDTIARVAQLNRAFNESIVGQGTRSSCGLDSQR
ncbi:Uncharacterised protein [Yersinia frederiksenii]|nr:Uncharacterised protein [Yersinia frederiksenii]